MLFLMFNTDTCDELSGEEMTVDEMKPNLDDFTTVRTISEGDFR